MKYGQLQYFSDELSQWHRISIFHRDVLEESLRQVNMILSFPVVPLPDLKAGNDLIDRLTVQMSLLELFSRDVHTQAKRLKKAMETPDQDALICDLQKNLREKMKKRQTKFIKTTFGCSTFLSEFFESSKIPVRA